MLHVNVWLLNRLFVKLTLDWVENKTNPSGTTLKYKMNSMVVYYTVKSQVPNALI